MSSSIHICKVSSGSFLHNDRTQKVSYLIDDSSLNECSRSSSDCLAEYQSLKLQASENYTKLTSQKMQKSTIFLKEAIVNLEEHHTLKDLEPIKERLESYGFKVLQMSIHRDEGFVNPENKKQKNYHAHITMFNLDLESGKSVKFGKTYRTELSKLQTLVADTLKMQRGTVSVQEHADELKVSVSKASKRLDTHDYKKAMKIKEEAQQQLTISQKQGLLKDITIVKSGYDFREMQAKITALETLTTEQKRELHSLNSQAKNTQELESKNIKIQELETKIQNLTATAAAADKEVKDLQEQKKVLVSTVIEALKPEQLEVLKPLQPLAAYKKSREFVKENVSEQKTEIKTLSEALQATKPLKTENDTLKSDLKRLKQDMSTLNTSLIESRAEVQTIEKHIEAQIEPTFEPQKSLEDRFYGFIKELKEQIKAQASEILSLKEQNNELKKQNQEYKELVSSQVQQIAYPKELYLQQFKAELDEITSIEELVEFKDEIYIQEYKPYPDEQTQLINQREQALYNIQTAPVTIEDIRRAEELHRLKYGIQDQGYSLS